MSQVMRNQIFASVFGDCIGRFVSEKFRNTEDRFSRVTAHIVISLVLLNQVILLGATENCKTLKLTDE